MSYNYRKLRREVNLLIQSNDDSRGSKHGNSPEIANENSNGSDIEFGTSSFINKELEQNFEDDAWNAPEDLHGVYASDSDNDTLEDFIDMENEETTLHQELTQWGARNSVTRACFNEILDIMRRYGNSNLPKDSRTLRSTPAKINSLSKCGGHYIYFGIQQNIMNQLETLHDLSGLNCIIGLVVNIDGVPLYKSSNAQFWPILCNFSDGNVFIVALYFGYSKPKVEEFLDDFIDEYARLNEAGITYNTQHYSVNIEKLICDAPARSLLKGTIGHTGYYSCERCVIKGSWEQRVVFNEEQKYAQRTDANFNEMEYESHQKHASPLLKANILCVKQFPLDYMHLVCLGVVRRILKYLKGEPRCCKLSVLQIKEISQNLISLHGHLPSEFVHQPRSLDDLDRWKATEFRQFLLYTGPVVLKGVVSNEVWEHFLMLSIAISILLESNPNKRNAYGPYAQVLLCYFVNNAKKIYGDTFTVYNVPWPNAYL